MRGITAENDCELNAVAKTQIFLDAIFHAN